MFYRSVHKSSDTNNHVNQFLLFSLLWNGKKKINPEISVFQLRRMKNSTVINLQITF